MNYRELQTALKGQTTVKLNSKASVLQAEYDRLFLNGETCELPTYSESMFSDDEPVNTDDVIITPSVATQQSELKQNKIEDLAGGSFYQRPVLKGKVNAQQVSEVKRQASQAPRLATPVKDKYSNKPQVNEVRQQAIKGSSKKVSCKFNTTHNDHFVNTNHKRYTDSLGTTEKQALDNLKGFVNAVKQVAVGFSQRQAQRNGIAA